MGKKLSYLLLLLVVVGCHPLFMFAPSSKMPSGQKKGIHIAINEHGIPFIKAETLDDVIYGLGFMHARDRLFQLDLIRHAAHGRVAELFGERALAFDKKLRLLSFRLDEQLKNLSASEHHLLDIYIQGVNDGAKNRGRSAEHFLLGIQFEPFLKRDVIAIARLQAWQLGSDLFAEITRLKIARSPISLAAKQELLSPVDDHASAIIKTPAQAQADFSLPRHIKNQQKPKKQTISYPMVMESGASNAWVIHGALSENHHALLMNDPHLNHNWPSNFYLATLQAKDFFVTGASFVGLPGILIGANKHIAWGVTASYANTQDAVLLKTEENSYVVDGKKLAFTPWPQRYCLDKKGNCKNEINRMSIFGPVVSHSLDSWIDESDSLAILWTGFKVEQHEQVAGSFIKLAQAHDVVAGVKAVQAMTFPGVNVVLADTEKNIAYAYAGLIPKRDPHQSLSFPLDGSLSRSQWTGFLLPEQKPKLVNPKAGYIVTANQNIFNDDAASIYDFGKFGAPPYRALRIAHQIAAMHASDKQLSFEALSAIQLDPTSVEAQGLAHGLGSYCVEHFKDQSSNKIQFAKNIQNFDGRYTTGSLAALPYELLINAIVKKKLSPMLGDLVPDFAAYTGQVIYALKAALLKEVNHKKTAIFAISEGHKDFRDFMAASCDDAFNDIVQKAGSDQWSWRWGRHHYLLRQSPLAQIPVLGGLFRDKKREVAGVASSPLAEAGLPVQHGANLRFKAILSKPIKVFSIIDSGNSGTIGHKNAFDQAPLWHEGKSIVLETDWLQAQKQASIKLEL